MTANLYLYVLLLEPLEGHVNIRSLVEALYDEVRITWHKGAIDKQA